MNNGPLYLLMIAFSTTCRFAMASEVHYECPKEIHTEQNAVQGKVPEGWQPKRGYNFDLQFHTHLAVYDGPPDEGASLVPDNEENDDPAKAVWTFNKKKERSIWLGCEYSGTRVLLAKELPKEITSCRPLLSKTKPRISTGLACK